MPLRLQGWLSPLVQLKRHWHTNKAIRNPTSNFHVRHSVYTRTCTKRPTILRNGSLPELCRTLSVFARCAICLLYTSPSPRDRG
eukprot:3338469-Amphidinium_carterae.1